jgi:hypothetical protein
MKEQGVAADVKFMNPKCSDGTVDCHKRCKCPCSKACDFSIGQYGSSCKNVSSICAPDGVFTTDKCHAETVKCEIYDAQSKSWSPMSTTDAAAAYGTLGKEITECCAAAAKDGQGKWGKSMLTTLQSENRKRVENDHKVLDQFLATTVQKAKSGSFVSVDSEMAKYFQDKELLSKSLQDVVARHAEQVDAINQKYLEQLERSSEKRLEMLRKLQEAIKQASTAKDRRRLRQQITTTNRDYNKEKIRLMKRKNKMLRSAKRGKVKDTGKIVRQMHRNKVKAARRKLLETQKQNSGLDVLLALLETEQQEETASGVSTHASGLAGGSSDASMSSFDSPDRSRDELMSLLESKETEKVKGFSCW